MPREAFGIFSVALVLLVALVASSADAPAGADAVGVEFFEKRIRPLLAENCFSCHGPDKQRNGLRLDSVASILKGGDRGPPIVPGNPEKSILIRAVRYADMELRMPPKGKLTDEQIADLVAWVKGGAPGPKDTVIAKGAGEFNLEERLKHWAYQPVRRVQPPEVKNTSWPTTSVDRFILAKLEAAGLSPAPPAEKRALLRRATFDLIGLPPTPEELAAFLADDGPDAYERVVDRLLASPHYGERWGRHWLDLVRYSETLGHEFDFDIYNAWRYRDYVIRALNTDLPYDQFVIEHLAGDLLPVPRRHTPPHSPPWQGGEGGGNNESIIGTGCFWFGEGKQAPVDVRQEQADRIDNQIDVLGKAFLAQTIACARCHDHKFDAIPTKDYYALAGYLKSSRYQQAFLDPPERFTAKAEQLTALQVEMKQKLATHWRGQAAEIPKYLIAAQRVLARGEVSLAAVARAEQLDTGHLQCWVKSLSQNDNQNSDHPLYVFHVAALRPLGTEADAAAQRFAELQDLAKSVSATPCPPSDAAVPPARFENFTFIAPGSWSLTGDAFDWRTTAADDLLIDTTSATHPIRLASEGWVYSQRLSRRFEGDLRSKTFAIDHDFIHYRVAGRGVWINLVVDGFYIIREPIYGGLSLEINNEKPHWRLMDVRMWKGHRAHIEILDSGTLHPSQPLNPETAAGRAARGHIALDELWFSDSTTPPSPSLSELPVRLLGDSKALSGEKIAASYGNELALLCDHWSKAPEDRLVNKGGLGDFVNWLLEQELLDASPAKDLLDRYREIEATIPAPLRAPALADGTGEDEVVFLRGNYRTPGPVAPRGLLTAVAGRNQPVPREGSGRLELAQRLASADNPLFARVLVNRLWQHHFGQGIVRTPDDFGRMGERPTHPNLLDFLADEFVRRGWSIKALHRLIVLSSAYRMSSKPDPAAMKTDPQIRMCHHVPLHRLEAEAIRDAILSVSGRLDRQTFGPSVPPYLTPFMEGRGRPEKSGPLDGAGRRSIYLSVRRNFLNPMFLAFDYPLPFTTIGRRSVSNVPAQALTMLNDPFVIQQARLWAERTLAGKRHNADQRIGQLYLTAFSREPTERELANAKKFLKSTAEQRRCEAESVDVWTDLCHVLLNAKEFVFID